ncbi:MAG: hypothetical protein PW843_01680 [Azospirillaceae bacterium]|nr:hypothetical protein [Azospirillaceae bacterium]
MDRLRARIPFFRAFQERAQSDWRLAAYDLQPLVWSPGVRDALAGVVAFFQAKSLWPSPSNVARSWARDLAWQGLVTLPPLGGDRLAEIRAHFDSLPRPVADGTGTASYAAADVLAAPHVLSLLNDSTLLDMAEVYLGCKPVLDAVRCGWTDGAAPAPGYRRAWDTLKGFTLFFHLTDVPEDGAFVFVRGSHRDSRLAVAWPCEDVLVHRLFGVDKATALAGPAGTRFIADTAGFHKRRLGTAGAGGLVLSAQYNVHASPHMPRPPWLGRDSNFDPDVNQLIMRRR